LTTHDELVRACGAQSVENCAADVKMTTTSPVCESLGSPVTPISGKSFVSFHNIQATYAVRLFDCWQRKAGVAEPEKMEIYCDGSAGERRTCIVDPVET